MLTIFSCPKPFEGHIDIIQRNAICSWKRLDPHIEIILFGDDEGIAEIAKEYELRHIADIERNNFGTPLLNDVFKKVHQEAKNEVICYVNSDIILLHDFLDAILKIKKIEKEFLLIGQRWDVKMDFLLDISDEHYEEKIRKYLTKDAKLHPPAGSDFFVFPQWSFQKIPPFAVGRAGWDNWMIFHSCETGIPVIDITPVTLVIHQNHDYRHVKQSHNYSYENPESEENRKIIGNTKNIYTLKDADYSLSSNGLKVNIKKRLFSRFRALIQGT